MSPFARALFHELAISSGAGIATVGGASSNTWVAGCSFTIWVGSGWACGWQAAVRANRMAMMSVKIVKDAFLFIYFISTSYLIFWAALKVGRNLFTSFRAGHEQGEGAIYLRCFALCVLHRAQHARRPLQKASILNGFGLNHPWGSKFGR